MNLEVYQVFAYLVIGLAIVMYVVLDGFDLGVGIIHIFSRTDEERRVNLNAIGPFWDGNAVWLVVVAGGLLSAFPFVYGSLFSGFYLTTMIVLASIIFRIAALEFRSKKEGKFWRSIWDIIFWLTSIAISFFAGLVIGNLITGVPLNANREIIFQFGDQFGLYPIFVGIMTVLLLASHGNLFLVLKTTKKIYEQALQKTPITSALFFIGFLVVTVWTWIEYPYMTERMNQHILFYLVPLLMVISMVMQIILTHYRKHFLAFISSSLVIALLFINFGIGTFPNMIISNIDVANSLTLFNASAQISTLKIYMFVVVVGLPLVFLYITVLYSVFRAKTEVQKDGSGY